MPCLFRMRKESKEIAQWILKPRKANVAQSMGGYLWAVSFIGWGEMQVRCLTETRVEVIKPPLQVIHIGNGCEGYSPSIKIPAKSELTSQNDIAERTTYFLDFNAQYVKSKDMGPLEFIWIGQIYWKEIKRHDRNATSPTPNELWQPKLKELVS